MELVVLNTSGKETGRKVTFDETVFGIEPNQHAVYLEVKQYLAAQRQGTHKSKESEITASTRKLKKQKGSGSADMVILNLQLSKEVEYSVQNQETTDSN
jgi:large subunit ribosomal protein L4